MCQFWNTIVEYFGDIWSKVRSFFQYLLWHQNYFGTDYSPPIFRSTPIMPSYVNCIFFQSFSPHYIAFWNLHTPCLQLAVLKSKGQEKPSLQIKLNIACILLIQTLHSMYLGVNLKMKKPTSCCCFTCIVHGSSPPIIFFGGGGAGSLKISDQNNWGGTWAKK